eukprot:m.445707 g.445707  ORF g.445707 m.445707 type:complete len:57 (+) comp19267_c0_seq1:5840-6010(+)
MTIVGMMNVTNFLSGPSGKAKGTGVLTPTVSSQIAGFSLPPTTGSENERLCTLIET